MPAAVLANVGEMVMLDTMLAAPLFLRLFNAAVPVVWTSLLPDFPVCTFPGYADMDVTGIWPAAQIDGTGQAYSNPNPFVWTRGPGGVPETVYGFVLYQYPAPDSILVAGGLFTMPIPTSLPDEVIALSLLVVLLRG